MLSYLRNLDEDHPFLVNEIEVMEQQIHAEKQALEGLNLFQILKKLVTNKNNQYILFLGLGIQVLGQLSGGGVYTVFAPKIFGLLGRARWNQDQVPDHWYLRYRQTSQFARRCLLPCRHAGP